MAKLKQFCVFFLHHSEAEESVAFVSNLPCQPLLPLIQNTCICVYVHMCLRAACGYCYATLVSPKRAPLYCCLYTLNAPNNYLLSNPVVVVCQVCCLVQANPGPLCSSRSRYERAPPLHIPRLHIECIYCATYILCAYRSFSFSFRIALPPLRSLPVTSIVQPQ